MNMPPSTAASTRRSAFERWAGFGAIVYVALFIVGTILIGDGPGVDASPAEFVTYYGDGDNRTKAGVGWLLGMFGVFFFLVFLAGLKQVVRRLDGDSFLATLVGAGGAVYAALTVTAFTVAAALKTQADESFEHRVYPELVSLADPLWYLLHSAGGIGAAAMMIGASAAALRARALPEWAAWVGILAGISAAVSFLFVPWIVVALWLVVAGVLVARAAAAHGTQSGPR